MEGDTSKKVIVVTGATGGLGLALSEYFIKAAHTVIGCGRNESKIDELNGKFATETAKFYVVDIASDKAVQEWAKQVVEKYGPPDFLVNNAGVVNEREKLWNISAEQFDKVIDINIKGTVNCIRHFVPAMVEAKKGVIVNVTSAWGKSAAKEVAPYCCSKWGLEGLSKALAMELPAPLACIPLSPGIINTDMLHTAIGDSANLYPSPEQWVDRAATRILSLDRGDNGESIDV